MASRCQTKHVHEGEYVAEVEVELLDPYHLARATKPVLLAPAGSSAATQAALVR